MNFIGICVVVLPACFFQVNFCSKSSCLFGLSKLNFQNRSVQLYNKKSFHLKLMFLLNVLNQ